MAACKHEKKNIKDLHFTHAYAVGNEVGLSVRQPNNLDSRTTENKRDPLLPGPYRLFRFSIPSPDYFIHEGEGTCNLLQA